jgi:hypothetical protein
MPRNAHCHDAVRIWTFLYFVPEIMAFSSIAPNGPYLPELAARTAMWGTLGWLGRGPIALDSLVLLMALARPIARSASVQSDPPTRQRPRRERELIAAGVEKG